MRRIIISILFCIVATSGLAKEKFIVGFAQDTMGNDWRIAQVRQVEEALKPYPDIAFIYSDGQGKTALQLKNIEEMISKKVDVLITSPRNAELMTPVITRAYRAGIPVVLLSRTINSEAYTTFIHPDNREVAKMAAETIAKKLNYKGNVFILQHIPTTTPGIHRTEGFFETIKKYPGIKVVGMKVANSLRADAIKMTEAALAEGLKFDAVYAQSDSMAVGAIMALKKHGIDPKTLVITGIDYISEARELIRKGEIYASFVYPTSGKEGALAAVRILRGEKVAKEQVIPTVAVTRENVEEIEPIF